MVGSTDLQQALVPRMSLGEYKDYLPTSAQTTTLVAGENTMVFRYAKLDDIKYTVETSSPMAPSLTNSPRRTFRGSSMQVVGHLPGGRHLKPPTTATCSRTAPPRSPRHWASAK